MTGFSIASFNVKNLIGPDLTQYDPVGPALGGLRASLRHMAETRVRHHAVIAELQAGKLVKRRGDFNTGEHTPSSEITSGTHQDTQAPEDTKALCLHSAERRFGGKPARDMVYTAAFGGTCASTDQIYMSRHFLDGVRDSTGQMDYFSILNDRLTDGSHPEAPDNTLASDPGQIIAHMWPKD